MIAHRFDPSILRAYDIRGVLDETLGAADAVAIGCAFGTIVRRRGGRTVNVGYDGRHSSPGLADRLVHRRRGSESRARPDSNALF
jgi:phosphomannomutase